MNKNFNFKKQNEEKAGWLRYPELRNISLNIRSQSLDISSMLTSGIVDYFLLYEKLYTNHIRMWNSHNIFFGF